MIDGIVEPKVKLSFCFMCNGIKIIIFAPMWKNYVLIAYNLYTIIIGRILYIQFFILFFYFKVYYCLRLDDNDRR